MAPTPERASGESELAPAREQEPAEPVIEGDVDGLNNRGAV